MVFIVVCLFLIGWRFAVGGWWLFVLGVLCLLFVVWCLLLGALVVVCCLVGSRWLSAVLLDVVGWLMVVGWVIVCRALCVIRSLLRATLHFALFSVSGCWLLVVVCCKVFVVSWQLLVVGDWLMVVVLVILVCCVLVVGCVLMDVC